jgi:hypothetical protein
MVAKPPSQTKERLTIRKAPASLPGLFARIQAQIFVFTEPALQRTQIVGHVAELPDQLGIAPGPGIAGLLCSGCQYVFTSLEPAV